MDNTLLKLLSEVGPPRFKVQCPSPGELIAAARRTPLESGIGGALAWHIGSCAGCAIRWELLQSDEHVDLAELYAGRLLAEENFTRLRAADHVERCGGCRRAGSLADAILLASDPRSVHFNNLGLTLRGELHREVMRAEAAHVVDALVLNPNGKPRLRRERIERLEVPVRTAALAEDGKLDVELEVPADCLEVLLAVSSRQAAVMFAPSRPDGNISHFRAETRLRGPYRLLPASSLSAWIVRP